MTTYLQHPLSAAFPGMTEADHAALTADIEQHGQRDPITLHDGMVLDGWHRHGSCLKLGIEPICTTLPEGVDPVAFVKSRNLHRRHLTDSQRSAAIVACGNWAGIGSNQHGGCKPGLQATASEMAKEADVSRQTIQHAKAAHVAGLGEHVRDGEITAKQGAAIAKLPENQRAAAVKNPAMLKTAKQPSLSPPAIEIEPEYSSPKVEVENASEANLRMLEGMLKSKPTFIELNPKQPGTPTANSEPPGEEMITITRTDHDELMALVEDAHASQKALEAVLDADDKLMEATRQITMLTKQNATLAISRDGYMNGKNAALDLLKPRDREIAKLRKEIEILKKALAEFDVKEHADGLPV